MDWMLLIGHQRIEDTEWIFDMGCSRLDIMDSIEWNGLDVGEMLLHKGYWILEVGQN